MEPTWPARRLAAAIAGRQLASRELLQAFLDGSSASTRPSTRSSPSRQTAPCGRRPPRTRRWPGPRPRPAAPPPGDHQGRDRGRRAEVDGRGGRAVRSCSPGRRRRGLEAPRRRRDRLREDQRPAVVVGYPDLQRALRDDEQPVGSGSHAGRVVGGRCRRGRRRADELRARHRYRRLGAHSGALLRRVRAEAELRGHPAARVPRPRRRGTTDAAEAVGGSHRKWLQADQDRAALRQVWACWF